MAEQTYTSLDRFMEHLDRALHTVFGPPPPSGRPSPGPEKPDAALNASERVLAGRLMRVNHVGEICAQALYQGQAMTATLSTVRERMEQAAQEENDHLAWTAQRLRELGTHESYLNPIWYTGSFLLGAAAGTLGDRWSLGFVAETEKQVVDHLTDHLHRLPTGDEKSRAILEQMRDDEGRHATVAIESGAAPLPETVRHAMRCASSIMTRTSYWV